MYHKYILKSRGNAMAVYKSNVNGRLKANGQILQFGETIELTDVQIQANRMLKNLIVTRQLLLVSR